MKQPRSRRLRGVWRVAALGGIFVTLIGLLYLSRPTVHNQGPAGHPPHYHSVRPLPTVALSSQHANSAQNAVAHTAFERLNPHASTVSVASRRQSVSQAPSIAGERLVMLPCGCFDDDESKRPSNATCDAATARGLGVPGLKTRAGFLSPAEADALLTEMNSFTFQPYFGKSCLEIGQNFSFYVPHATTDVFPPRLDALRRRMFREGILPHLPNYALVNQYTPGQGIHPHVDDDFYSDGIASVTLGDGGVLRFFLDPYAPYWKGRAAVADEEIEVTKNIVMPAEERLGRLANIKQSGALCGSAYFTPGALFAMKAEARYGWKHEMRPAKVDIVAGKQVPRGMRTAVTFRYVKESVIEQRHRGGKVPAKAAY